MEKNYSQKEVRCHYSSQAIRDLHETNGYIPDCSWEKFTGNNSGRKIKLATHRRRSYSGDF